MSFRRKNHNGMMITGRRKWLWYLAVLLLCGYVMIHHVTQRVDVFGVSMEPEFVEGDVLLVNKLCRKFTEIERFDVVVFQYEYRDNEYYIKRVIGLPGETVQIVDGKVYIDGERLDDKYGTEPIEKPRRAAEPVTLGEDEYFLLGDNRNDSSDSRDSDIGNVSGDQIIAKAGIKIRCGDKH